MSNPQEALAVRSGIGQNIDARLYTYRQFPMVNTRAVRRNSHTGGQTVVITPPIQRWIPEEICRTRCLHLILRPLVLFDGVAI